ncbi:MAG TPA: hypothetical protein VFM18_07395 [Methanosarcina sp.]|nr:hypothetical protein [Methanosarcina sp.]
MRERLAEVTYVAFFDKEGVYRVAGPGQGLSYSSGTLFPEFNFKDKNDAETAARIADIAFVEGKRAAQEEVRGALGIKS